MSESHTMFNERDRRCAAVQLMLSTDLSYDNRTIASTLKMQIWIATNNRDLSRVMKTKFPATVMVFGVVSSEGHIMPLTSSKSAWKSTPKWTCMCWRAWWSPGAIYIYIYIYTCCIAVIQPHVYIHMWKHNHNNDERTHFFRKIYLSHFIRKGSKRVVCERWVGDWIDCIILTLSSSDYSSTSFSFCWAAQPGVTEGPSPLLGADSHCLKLQLELQLPDSNSLELFVAPGYIIVWYTPASHGRRNCTEFNLSTV